MWDSLTEEINEEFNDLQPETLTWAHIDRSVMEPDPTNYLSDEIDMQEWQKHVQLTTPMPEINFGTEPTCLCINTSRRRWKNQHGEGTYIHVHSYMGYSWSEQDLEEMSTNSSSEPKEPTAPFPPKPEKSEPAEEILQDVYPVSNTIRVQISMKQKGTDVKGRYGNFEIPNGDLMAIFQICHSLLRTFPRQPRKLINYYTRIQLQNKIGTKMQGGRNLSLHNATPEQIVPLLQTLFDEQGWLAPRPGAGENKVTSQKESSISSDRGSQSEDGPPKPGNQSVSRQGGRGVICQNQKSAKLRASLLAEIAELYG